MSFINRIRVVNVQYNGGRQIYDDFVLTLLGKSAAFDMYNGGGKSVLLCMVLQTVLPKSDLSDRHPYQDLFKNTSNDKPHHVLVEWELDEDSEYKYMVTGFCARKAKNVFNGGEDEVSLGKTNIDYFSYIIFYNRPGKFDIETLPLCVKEGGKSHYIGYEDLKALLKCYVREKHPVYLPESMTEYWSFIKDRGLIQPEWELIRKVNPKENYITTYFREHKTSRKLIENFFIGLIEDIENISSGDGRKKSLTEAHLAETLLEIKEQLKKLLKEKELHYEYEKVVSFYKSLENIELKIKAGFVDLEETKDLFVQVFHKLKELLKSISMERMELEQSGREIEKEIYQFRFQNQCLEIQKDEITLDGLKLKEQEMSKEYDTNEAEREKTERACKRAKAQNQLINYLEAKKELDSTYRQIKDKTKEHTDLKRECEIFGYNFHDHLKKKQAVVETKKAEINTALEETEYAQKILDGKRTELDKTIGGKQTEVNIKKELLGNAEEEAEIIADEFRRKGLFNWLLDPETFLRQLADAQEKMDMESRQAQEKIDILNKEKNDAEKNQREKEVILKHTEQGLADLEDFLSGYSLKKISVDQLVSRYLSQGSYDQLLKRIEEEIKLDYRKTSQFEIKESLVAQKIRLLEEKGYYLPNQDILSLAEHLEKKESITPIFGAEYLMSDIPEEERKELLDKNPLLPYSLLINDANFHKIKSKERLLNAPISDFSIPIFNLESFRGEKRFDFTDVIFTCAAKDTFLGAKNIDDFKNSLKAEKNQLSKEKDIFEKQKGLKEVDKAEVLSFLSVHKEIEESRQKYGSLGKEKEQTISALRELKETISANGKEITSLHERISSLEAHSKENRDNQRKLEKFIGFRKEIERLSPVVKKLIGELEELTKVSHRMNKEKARLAEGIKEYTGHLTGIIDTLKEIAKLIKEVEDYQETELLDLPLDIIEEEYRSKKKVLEDKTGDVNSLRTRVEDLKKLMQAYEKHIIELGFTLEDFQVSPGEVMTAVSADYIDSLAQKEQSLRILLKKQKEELSQVNTKMSQLISRIATLKEKLPEAYSKATDIDSEEDILALIKQNEERINDLNVSLNSIHEKVEFLKGEENKANQEHMRFEHFIREKQFETEDKGISETLIAYEELESRYKDQVEYINGQRNKLQKEIGRIETEGQQLTINNDYIQDIKKLSHPESYHDVERHLETINIVVAVIQEKLWEIEKEITALEEYQDVFIQHCLQIAEFIFTKLRKMESLPKVDVYGFKVRMVEFKNLTGYPPELKKERMKHYIEGLIRRMEEDNIDVVKLREYLAPKVLLAQIIDMDKVKVLVYKVERIPENCRHLYWENPEGSEGQANMMYIVFLASMLAFIRSVYQGDNSVKSKKVLILDSPFSSTTAYHLWEPIFDVLKKNNFQFIATGHSIPEEIIAKFDIVYLLGQEEYTSSRQVTVVKKVRTELDLNQVHYGIIEQPSLFN